MNFPQFASTTFRYAAFILNQDQIIIIQRCGVYIEAHEYTNTHYLCFACQSTEAFLEDSRYFEVQKMQFSIREEAEDDECTQDIEYGEDKEDDENDENEMF